VNWTAGLDPKTGQPVEYDPSKQLQEYAGKGPRYGAKAMGVQPAHYGMPTLFPNHYDNATHTVYVSFMEGVGNYFNTLPADPSKQAIGNGFREIFCNSHPVENDVEPVERSARNPNCKPSHGVIEGIDVTTGKVVKRQEWKYPAYSGVLGTDGGLLFFGDEMGRLIAVDKNDLKELWSFQSGTIFSNNFITYEVDGKQYVATILGGSSNVRDEGSWPERADQTHNEMLAVFGL
jgi:alcohol dehydrogenase (cytochrome c)